jgi:hypothetical protein
MNHEITVRIRQAQGSKAMAMSPGLLSKADAHSFRLRLNQMNEWDLRVLASLLWMQKHDHDTSDLAGLPALLDFLTPADIEDADDLDGDDDA